MTSSWTIVTQKQKSPRTDQLKYTSNRDSHLKIRAVHYNNLRLMDFVWRKENISKMLMKYAIYHQLFHRNVFWPGDVVKIGRRNRRHIEFKNVLYLHQKINMMYNAFRHQWGHIHHILATHTPYIYMDDNVAYRNGKFLTICITLDICKSWVFYDCHRIKYVWTE